MTCTQTLIKRAGIKDWFGKRNNNAEDEEFLAYPLMSKYDKASKSAISSLEKKLGVKFPASYKNLWLKPHNLSRSFRSDGPGKEYSLDHMLVPSARSKYGIYNKMKMYKDVDYDIFNGTIPIAASAGGDYYALKYNNKKNPSVVYVDHEETGPEHITPLFNSMKDFIAALKTIKR